MRSHTLLLGLKSFVRQTLAESVPTPQVHVYDIPKTEQTRFPFVVLRLMKGATEEETCEDVVGILLGVHAPENPETAGLVCAALGDALRQALWRQRILDDLFELQMPFDILQPEPDRKQHDYHMFTLVTHWNYILPQRPLGEVYANEQLVTRIHHG